MTTALGYFGARAAAGRAALSIADDHTPQDAAAIVRGAMHGFLMCSAQFDGWDATLKAINEIAAAARAPAEKSKPTLTVVGQGRMA